jgi:DNA-binding MarR family transcriptional regulator
MTEPVVATRSDERPRFAYTVKQLELVIRANMDSQSRLHGLTALQYTALTVLRRSPGMSCAQLSRRSFVSAQAGSELVAHLERKGLVDRQPDTRNRRILRIKLTERGHEVVEQCDVWMDQLERAMLADVPPDEAKRTRRVHERCLQNLTRLTPG